MFSREAVSVNTKMHGETPFTACKGRVGLRAESERQAPVRAAQSDSSQPPANFVSRFAR